MNHNIVLPQLSVKYLRDMLSATGWAKDVSDIITGGVLLGEVVPEYSEAPTATSGETGPELAKRIREWAAGPVAEFVVTEKQRDACKKCIEHFAKGGNIPPTPQAAQLLTTFGFQ